MGCDDSGAPPLVGWKRLFVPIEAGNASPGHTAAVVEAAEGLGEATVRRLRGDFSIGGLTAWNDAVRAFAIVARHQPAHVRGRNAADIALAVDAMDPMFGHRLDGFVPVRSGSDITRLAQRLREGGLAVCGLGESKTPRAFRSACHLFEIVGNGAGTRPGRCIQVRNR